MNFVADIRGDLIFDGFETAVIAPVLSDEHDLNLSSEHTQEMDPVAATASEPKQIAPSKATNSTVLEPHTDSISYNIRTNGTPDSFSATCSRSDTPADSELDRLSIFEFSAADFFQHSPFGDILNSLKNLSLEEDSQLNYV